MDRKKLNKNEIIYEVSKFLQEHKTLDFYTLHKKVMKFIDYLPHECQALFYELYSFKAFETKSKRLLLLSLMICLAPLLIPDYKSYNIKTIKTKTLFKLTKTLKRKLKTEILLPNS